jgi:PAS domain S-box-containing protein
MESNPPRNQAEQRLAQSIEALTPDSLTPENLEAFREQFRRQLQELQTYEAEMERRNAALYASEERFRVLVETTAQAVWETDSEGVVVTDSPSWRAYTGQTLADWLGYGWLNAVHPGDRAYAERQWRESVAGGESYDAEYRLRSPDGGWRWTHVHAAPLRDAEGRIFKWVGMNQDISERRRVEEQRQQFVSLAETSHEFIGMCDLELKPFFVNAAGMAMMGLEGLAEAVNVPVEAFFFPEDRPFIREEFFPKVLRDGFSEVEIRFRHFKTGEPLWMIYAVFALKDTDGHMSGYATVSRNITERKQAEEREQRLKALMDHNPSLVFMKDEEGRYLYLNGTYESQFVGSKDWLGKTDFDFWPQDSAEMFRAHDAEVLQAEETKQFLEDSTGLDGQRYCWLCFKFPFTDAQNRRYVGGIAVDVTARVAAEEALREREEHLRLALAGAHAGMWMWDLTDGWTTTPQINVLFGRPSDGPPLRYEEFSDLIHPDDRERVTQSWNRTLDRGEPYEEEYRIFWPDGAVRWLSSKGGLLTVRSGRKQFIGMSYDITERKRAEAALRHSEEKFRVLFETMDQGFVIIEKVATPAGQPSDFRYLTVNPAFERHSGQCDVVGKTVREFVPGIEQGIMNLFDEVVRTGQHQRFESHVPALDLWFDVEAFPAQEPHQIAVLFSNISERKRAQQALRDYADRLEDADRRKNEFLAMLAHELRNPLAPIRNAVEVLRKSDADSPAPREHLRRLLPMIDRQVHHLVRLVDDLLEVSRISRGKIELRKEPVDLASVIGHAIDTSQPFIQAAGHTLKLALPEEPVRLVADPVRLAQVFSNLLNNAAKFTPAGGHIGLRAERSGPEVVVSVSDTGEGIPADLLPKVFDPFTQADRSIDRAQGGLGLGLALARSLVELHGGRVAVHSGGLGRGSEFVVRLPVAEVTPAVPTGPEPASSSSLVHRILVVDDNRDAADSLALLLTALPVEVQAVYGGAAALDALAMFRPEVILLDLGMPGMDGYETARHIRQHPNGRDIPLVALTGWGQEEDRQRTREAGFNHHLVKPVAFEALQTLLATLTGPEKEILPSQC